MASTQTPSRKQAKDAKLNELTSGPEKDDYGLDGEVLRTIRNPVTGVVINLIWNGTQAEYDAIAIKDANTLYVIVG